ncbi:Amylopullulanase [Bifidobacterium pseudolongum subsp. globosum]|nr:Amylopullulanase [Bifidobacterium pseudolongum subsp. globosum]RYQ09536.1 Amylopullulanase [Bifidobacterium pseudolongum subsp. globosum]RYQ14464.1 Amylopullulanase [Bifidobacterium pseudolongum subsp. globosum]RYQ15940.1 Amylopullulanase [Bifidobacterium pseudolongum subsp. globosum]
MVIQQVRDCMRRTTGIGVAIAMVGTGALLAVPMAANAAEDTGQTTLPAKTDVQVIAFQQTWNSIAKECTNTYGPQGVAYVEISPPQESIQGTEWWTSYQPVSYKLDSKLGTEAEFKNMITTCDAAGVGIIADVVLNQTTGLDVAAGEQTGVAGTKYNGLTGDYPGFTGENGQYPQGVTAADFHDYNNGASVSDYKNQQEVQEGRLNSMWDFDTSSEKVQDIQSDYLAKLYKMGVKGFRMDAVKHINNEDIKGIKDKMAQKVGKNANDIYWIQEVIGNASEAPGIQPRNYLETGTVTQFDYKSDLNVKFKGKIAELKDLSTRIGDLSSNPNAIASKDANVFVTNWDTARNDGAITYKNDSMYALANAFMLAYDYGTPRLLSDYKYDDNAAGAPGATATAVPDVDFDQACSTKDGDWNCQQRWTTTRGMIAFHNYVDGTSVSDWQDDGANNIAFSRGDKGFVAINNSTEDKEAEYATSMPDGEYCDVYAVQDCSKTVTVSGGKAKVTVPAMQAVAIYGGATKATHPASDVAVDPSTPDVVIPDTTVKPDDQTTTVWYKPTKKWDKVFVHHGAGSDWTAVPGEEMEGPDAQGYYKKTIDTKGEEHQICFNDGGSDWDSNNGSNYLIAKGITQVGVENGALSVGNPEAIGAQTRLVVHYKPATDEATANRGVYVWGKDTAGADMTAVNHPFTGEDCYGKVADLTFDGKFEDLGFIITTEDWNKFGGDRNVTVSKTGTVEVWVDGTGDASETLTEAPADYKCKADKVDVTVHYMRNDGLYFNAADTETKVPQWDLWMWNSNSNGFASKFTKHDDWGELATASFSNYTYQASNGESDFGLLRRYGADEWKKKDGSDGDIKMSADALVFSNDGTAKAEVWLLQDDPTVYTARPALGARISEAEIAQNNAIDAKLTKPADVKAEDVKVTDAKGNTVDIDAVKTDGTVVTVTLKDDLDLTAKYTVEIEGFGSADAVAGSVVRTDAFDKEYAYDGDDLGATWADDGTTFKLWAPTASKVELVTFKDAKTADAEAADTIAMDRGEKGVWSTTAKVADGTAYIYRVSFADGTVNDSADPYARASVVNGKRSVVLSPAKTTVKDSGRMAPFSKNTDAVIAETHIRDLTKNENSGVDAAKRGKYLGMIQNGTTNSAGKSTGVDYLKELGITHVQIQPMFDYASVDETKPLDDSNYNWGYDPLNYNVPEGSYASDPTDPANRVVEAKQMVDGLHANGLRVIMDVVYNHVADAATNPFGLTVPGYYFRYQNGSLVNNSGCGNDTASERAMMRKYIVDSVAYWAKEYNMDGFRFDLMGLHDVETMKQVRSALDKIDPSIIIVGEGWDMNTTMDKSAMSIQPNGYKLDTPNSTIAFFNDSIRDGLKGSVFSEEDNGFVSGKQGMEPLIMNNMLGCRNVDGTAEGAFCTNGNANVKYANAGQVVNYVEIHDNLTLNDKLEKSLFVQGRNEGLDEAGQKAKVIETSKLANSAVFMAFGISEFQVGQEFLRTKGGDENSYKSGDAVNAVDWDRMNDADYGEHAQYVKDLIAIRKKTSALRVESYKKISNSTKELKAADNVVAYEIARDNGTYVVALNAGDEAAAVPGVTAGDYGVLVSNGHTYLHPVQAVAQADNADGVDASVAGAAIAVKDGQNVVVPAHSAVLLAPVADLGQPDTPDQPTKPDTPVNPDEPGDTDKPAAGEQPDGQTGGNAAGSQSSTGAEQQVAGVASTGSAIALLVAVAVAFVAAGVGLLTVRRRD